MVKTTGNEEETMRSALIPEQEKETLTAANLRYTEEEIARFDAEGNFKCVRCGWTHTTTECAELRLVHAQRELEKVNKFVHMITTGHEGETPVDTLIRVCQKLHSDHTEVTEMMKEE